MTKFTKEQLIEQVQQNIAMLKATGARSSESSKVAILIAINEIALAALTGEPFMYGIVGPEGETYFDECCVSGGKYDLSEIVSNLNDQCESPGEEYREVPLYRLPLLEGLK